MTQQTNSQLLKNIRIVMVNTSHPGNIGAAARAMKNMGLEKLVLVEPKNYPSLEAIQRSVGAVDILDKATVVTDLNQAIEGCVWVAGTSARLRTIEWPILEPRDCIEKALQYLETEGTEQSEIAIVFGRENSGLTNEEMEKCNVLLHIPTDPDFSSLNIAAAIQVVCYEFRVALITDRIKAPKGSKHRFDVIADTTIMNGMYDHLFESLNHVGFFGDHNPEVVMRRLKGLFNRASTTRREVSIIRGICSAMQGKKLPR